MKLDVEELGATKRRMKVEIPRADIDVALGKAYNELNKSVKVDGFRPGKTPRAILEKRYSQSVEAEVMEKLVPEFYVKAVEEAKLYPVTDPAIEEKGLALKKGEPLNFTATFEVRPDFLLGEYKGIEVKEEKVEVTDEELAKAIDEIRDMHSTLESVEEDRPAVKGDFLIMDFEGFMDDKAIEGAKAENYSLELGSDSLIAGFEEQLIGVKKGEDREVKVTFPAEYRNKELAGREATFKVKVDELKKKALPAFDDEFAAASGVDKTAEGLKEKVKADILTMKKREASAKQKAHIVNELADRNQFELPPTMVEKETQALMARRYQEMTQGGRTPSANMDLKAMDAELRPLAGKRVKTSLILTAIAEKETIDVSEEDIMAAIKTMAVETGRNPKEIVEIYKKKEGGLDSLRAAMAEEKVLEFLLKEARKS